MAYTYLTKSMEEPVYLDFSSFCLISIPGFLVGIMVGKLIAGNRGKLLRQRFGFIWKIISIVAYSGYFLLTVVTLSIIVIHLVNSKQSPRPASYWVTIFVGLWMTYNIIYELMGFFIRSRTRDAQSLHN